MGWLTTVGMFFGFLVLLYAIALWEKHPIKAFGPAIEYNEPAFGAYLTKVDNDAYDLGLIKRSAHRHLKYNLYTVFWFSPDREILVLSGQGKIIGIKNKQTWIISELTNGEYIITTDSFDEGDHSGLSKQYRLIDAKLEKLLSKHRQHIEAEYSQIKTFTHTDGLSAFEEIKRKMAESLIRMGRAKWIDINETVWRYTQSGARCVCINHFTQIAIGFTQFWRVKRPGR